MSSPIHTARCVARTETSVDIELVPTTACSPHFPLSDFFAFALLHEAAHPDGFSNRSPGPLGREVAQDTVIDLAVVDSPERRALTRRFVVRAGYVRTRNWKPVVCTPDADGVYRTAASHQAPGAREVSEALDDIASVARGDDELPAAVLRIEVTEPRWAQHCVPGQVWDVYAFDDTASSLL